MRTETIAGYRIAEQLGAGAMGTVYRAEGPAGVVALKLVHEHLMTLPEGRLRFLREAALGARVRHPNVVATFEVGTEQREGRDALWLAMEYVRGQTLRQLAAEIGPFPEELCRHVGAEVARGLAAIHAAGIVHRDVKPDNVLVTEDRNVVKVMDLGLARLREESVALSRSGTFAGSIQYAAPEQLESPKDVDGRADLYALGVTLYELGTGVHPFQGETFAEVAQRILHEVPAPAGSLNPQLSACFEETIATLCAKDPGRRFADAEALLAVLEQGEESAWWRARAVELRERGKRPLRRARIPRESALTGRAAELSRLRAAYERARGGAGQVVLVEGEAGIGKSRLVDEFATTLVREGEDVHYLYGGHPPGGAATGHGAFGVAFREHFGEARLEESLRPHLADSATLASAFASALRNEPAPAGAEPLGRDSLQSLFVRMARSLAAERTTILLIDDLHFAPSDGLALFAALAFAVPEHRILLVGTTRPGLDPKWLASLSRHSHVARMPLPRLGRDDVARLLAESLGSEHAAGVLADRIAEKSDGNPYFVFEILRDLREAHVLEQRADGTWDATRRLEAISIPSTIGDLLRSRLAGLPDDLRETLEVAACCGFEFDPLLVAAVLGLDRIALLRRLASVEASRRLVRAAGRAFAFDHHQLQEVLYAEQSELLREGHHAAIAQALEARDNPSLADAKSLDGERRVAIAEHALLGRDTTRAARYAAEAIRELRRHSRHDVVVRLSQMALALPGVLEGSARCEVLLQRSGSLDPLGRPDLEREALEEACSVARRIGDLRRLGRALRALGWLAARGGETAAAQALLTEALDVARKGGDGWCERAVTVTLGTLHLEQGRLEDSETCQRRALDAARAAGDRSTEAIATGNLGIVLSRQGRKAEACECAERQVELARSLGDRRQEARALGNLGVLLDDFGRMDEAQVCLRRQLELAREIGDRRGEASAAGNLAALLVSVGSLTEALERQQRSLALSRENADAGGVSLALGNVALVLARCGRREEASDLAEQALLAARERKDAWDEANALEVLADVAWDSGDEDLAVCRAEEALAARRIARDRANTVASLLHQATFLVALRRHDEARRAISEATAGDPGPPTPAVAAVAEVMRAALGDADPSAARAALRAAGDRVSVVQRIAALHSLWKLTGDTSDLEEAGRLVDMLAASAPAAYRESLLRHVRLHRDVLEARARASTA